MARFCGGTVRNPQKLQWRCMPACNIFNPLITCHILPLKSSSLTGLREFLCGALPQRPGSAVACQGARQTVVMYRAFLSFFFAPEIPSSRLRRWTLKAATRCAIPPTITTTTNPITIFAKRYKHVKLWYLYDFVFKERKHFDKVIDVHRQVTRNSWQQLLQGHSRTER